MTARAWRVYLGAYTSRGGRGIYASRFDAESGGLAPAVLAAEAPNPTYLAAHPSGRFLYAVSEARDAGGRRGSAVTAFAVEPDAGGLSFLNRRPSGGSGPCHVSVDRAGRLALAANYASGSVSLFPIEEDGRLGAASDIVQHRGAGKDPKRQEGPHAHSVIPSPDNRFALAADLGLDRIMVYRLNAAEGRLQPNDPPWAPAAPGAGPRHMAFHPMLRVLYVVNELDNTVIAFDWDAERGALREAQTISTLPPDFDGVNYAAAIRVAPSGRFLYASNRGHDSIAVFAVDGQTGRLFPAGHDTTLGKWPRDFALDPSGRWLLAANQESDSVVVFRADAKTGRLSPAGAGIEVSMPVCVLMLP